MGRRIKLHILGSAKEITQKAEKAFNQPVPAELMNYLVKNKSSLLPELEGKWKAQGYKTSGNWRTVLVKALGKAGRRLNGDENHQGRHLRIPINAWVCRELNCTEQK